MDYVSNLVPGINPFLLLAAVMWSMFWKILALWRATKENRRYWFVAIFILNTFGIIEIAFLLYFAKKRMTLEDFKTLNFLPKS
jgi:Family of unknown function (DUF5652)